MKKNCVVAVAVALLFVMGLVRGGNAQASEIGAEIRNGSCANPREVVFQLQPPVIAAGDHVGNADGVQAASSFTPAPDTLDDLLGSPAVVTLSSGDTVTACGAIGGVLEPDGALGIVVRPTKASGPSGVAYFRATGDVSLFIDPGKATTSAAAQSAPKATTAPEAVEVAATSAPQGLTADEQAYVSAIQPIIHDTAASLGTASDLMTNPKPGDTNWTIDLAAQFAIWHDAYQQVTAITQPDAFAETHANVTEAFRLLDAAATDIAQGIDQNNPDLIAQATDELNQGAALMKTATDELNTIKTERGL